MAAKCDYLVFDISSVLYRTFYAHRTEDDTTIAGMASHSALTTLNKYYREFAPSKGVVMAFDRTSWRKAYMNSELAVSKKPYKGNRRKDMSPAQQLKFQRFMNHLRELEELVTKHTAITTMARDGLEADDLIAGFVQHHPDHQIIIISSDSDLVQLTRQTNVRVVSPATGKDQKLDKHDNDPDYYTFFKCIRGDTADNIQSALPGVRATRIRKAYDDPFERVNLMKEKWSDENGVEYLVEDLFFENDMLIHLEHQPEPIRQQILETVMEAVAADKKFSMFFIMQFIGKYQLNKIKENIDQYIPMLSKRGFH